VAKRSSSGGGEQYTLTLLRIIVGFTFCLHGLQKAFGFVGGHRFPITSLLGFAGLLETLGGLLIIAGLFTRPVAFLLCGEMAVAYFKQHATKGFWPINNGGELAVLYCFIFLYLVQAGGGPWSLDRMIRKAD
jgi:putative oxidoreductase